MRKKTQYIVVNEIYKTIYCGYPQKRAWNLFETDGEMISDLHTFCSSYDVYIAGSDQIWNSNYNGCVDPVYYLDFAPDNAKKVAYAASFGKSELEEYEIEDTKKLLKKFNAISVREVQAKSSSFFHPVGTYFFRKCVKIC